MAVGDLFRRGVRGLIRPRTAADNPPAGQRLLVAGTDGWYDRTSAGVETKLGGGGAPPVEVLAGQTYTAPAGQTVIGRPILIRGRVIIGDGAIVHQVVG